jgi:antitoxin (DNA-binding transcriptional repressor) of toxin-antitoxin stability system
MKNVVNVSDFRKNIAEYIDNIKYKKDVLILVKGKEVVAKVVPFNGPVERAASETSPLLQLAGLWSDEETEKVRQALKRLDEADKLKELSRTT